MGLTPGLSPLRMATTAAGASAGLTGALLLAAGTDATSLALSALAGGCVALTLHQRGAFRLSHEGRPRSMAMAIVPWGVLLQPEREQETRVLRWSGVRAVHVETIHTTDAAGAPRAAWSLVTVETHRERLQGRAPGHAPLERLMAHLPEYAREASLPVALGLTGEARREEAGFDPVARELLGQARLYLESAEGVEALSLRAGTYRTMARWSACEETLELLRETLRYAPEGAADRRAFCAALAGELGAKELLSDLLRLVTTAHPLTAATARAAALRLGAEPARAGALEELALFLHEDDLATLERWAGGGETCRGGPS